MSKPTKNKNNAETMTITLFIIIATMIIFVTISIKSTNVSNSIIPFVHATHRIVATPLVLALLDLCNCLFRDPL